jgi:hypothetical protein
LWGNQWVGYQSNWLDTEGRHSKVLRKGVYTREKRNKIYRFQGTISSESMAMLQFDSSLAVIPLTDRVGAIGLAGPEPGHDRGNSLHTAILFDIEHSALNTVMCQRFGGPRSCL